MPRAQAILETLSQKVCMTASHQVAIIGAGPAGLMAAQMLSATGAQVHVYDAMPSAGRKFLLAGIGGLNLSHSEPMAQFLTRYYEKKDDLAQALQSHAATQLIAWAKDLGIETFVGSSGRIFPTDMKAAPLLRAWLQRLRNQGVQFHMRHRWAGWDDTGALQFEKTATDKNVQHITINAQATVLAPTGTIAFEGVDLLAHTKRPAHRRPAAGSCPVSAPSCFRRP